MSIRGFSYGIEVDESLVGDKSKLLIVKNDDAAYKNETDDGQAVNNDDYLNVEKNEVNDIVVNGSAKEVFKSDIERARGVIGAKSGINKVKYGSDLVNDIDDIYNSGDIKRVVVNRATMKNNGAVKFSIDVKDSANTAAGALSQNLKNGYDSYSKGDYELAVMFYKQALTENKDSVEAQFGLGASYQKLMQFDQAIECYLKLLDRNFSRKKVINNLLLALSHKSYQDALGVLLAIDEKILGYDDVLSQIGVLYMRLGDNVKAISAFTKAYDIAPANAVVAYNLGILYDREKSYDYAKYFLEISIKNNISDFLSADDLEKLNKKLKEIDNEIALRSTKNS